MQQLLYTRDELMRSHDYAHPHMAGGQRLHGGFDADGRYIPPRTLLRRPAVDAWTRALRQRGGDLLQTDASLLKGQRAVNKEQQKLLLLNELGQTFWNTLTITGVIEGRGRMLASAPFPDLQPVIAEDISEMAIGHLHRGLLTAHGIDEGGEPDKGIGGHDVMWFALRDLAFGEVDFPMPEVPPRIGESVGQDNPLLEFLPPNYAGWISFLMTLLLIEFRAEIGFEFTQEVLHDPDLFAQRRPQAAEAAELVERIRADERIHVDSLRLYLGELRTLTFEPPGGGRVAAREPLDTLWAKLVHLATVVNPPLTAKQQLATVEQRVRQHPDGDRLWQQFQALA